MSKKIDHTYTDEVVCPHCGYEFGSSHELGEDGEVDCEKCGKSFLFCQNIEITYTTWKKKEVQP